MEHLEGGSKVEPTPSEEQEKSLKKIITWVKDSKTSPLLSGSDVWKRYGIILNGRAGTGKSYLTSVLVKRLVKDLRWSKNNIVMCAPTNQAVKVQVGLGTGLKCCTIYSLLGLTMKEEEEKLVLHKTESASDTKYKIVILDECGMLNAELLEYIRESMLRGVLYVFIGDNEQLNPIGEERSKVWDMFKTLTLTKVMRHDNQILELANKIRDSQTEVEKVSITANNDRKQGIWVVEGENFENRIRKYAKAGKFTTRSRALAWRNVRLDELNRWVREEIHGVEAIRRARYIIGDRLLFMSPMSVEDVKGRKVDIITNDEAVVKEISIRTHATLPSVKVYALLLYSYGRSMVVETVHEDSEKELDTILSNIAADAKKPGEGGLWKKFWGIKKSLANFKYSYAITVHRAQGSSYENVFVDARDILRNPNKNECRRCLYVGVTRPTKKLFIAR